MKPTPSAPPGARGPVSPADRIDALEREVAQLRAENEVLGRQRDDAQRRLFRHFAEQADLAFVAAGILEARSVEEIETVKRGRKAWDLVAFLEVRAMEAAAAHRRRPTHENRIRRDALRSLLREVRGHPAAQRAPSIFDEPQEGAAA